MVASAPIENDDTKNKRSQKGRVFQCTGYPDCNMSFTRSEHLARHKRKHTGERPFTCPHCSKNFSRLDNLRQHKQTVHAYEVYSVDKQSPQIPPIIATGLHPMHHHQLQQQYPSTYTPPLPQHGAQAHLIATNGNIHTANGCGNPYFMIEKSQPVTPSSSVFSTSSSPIGLYTPTSNSPYGNFGGISKPASMNSTSNSHKRRPKPLLLEQSFYNSDSSANSYIYPQLRSASSIPQDVNKVTSYGPRSASLMPHVVSPLSPLFHQSFKQTITLDQPSNSSTQTLKSPSQLSTAVQPQQTSSSHIKSSPSLSSQVEVSKTVENSVNSASVVTPVNSSSRDWLRGVLNEEKTQESSPQTISRKPTIDSLLSPY